MITKEIFSYLSLNKTFKLIKIKITKRDVRIFILGMIAFFAIESIYSWKETKSEFLRGWNDGNDYPAATKTN
ncbi:hypothetical protein [Flavobacterium degerlachei]|uniref:Uncharacterized protein n=1 Tax=Flavobacterium degerlachei TaxID=229203 RepID=A0A1H2X1W0_9FLAO|nr:hypothetical protein [Flavobacterium degerlachei]SDW86835.1 hypothetical protein SAMN05444338_105123 [Flavobacterium degerlachei]